MVSIDWAKDNCNRNLVKEREIAEAKAWLERKIDNKITEACMRGKHDCGFFPEYLENRPDNIRLHKEAIEEVMNKYEKGGYTIKAHDRECNIFYQMSW